MNFFKKIQKLDIFWRKFIVFAVLLGMGVPLLVLAGFNFKEKLVEMKKGDFSENFNISELKERMSNIPSEEIKETAGDLEKELNKLESSSTENQ